MACRTDKEGLKNYHKEWAAKNKERVRASRAKWAKNNPEKQKDAQHEYEKRNEDEVAKRKAKWRTSNATYSSDWYCRKNYAISSQEANRLKAERGCESCGERDISKLRIDHEHGVEPNMRGVLCHKCNSALGYLKDSPAVVIGLYNYIARSKFRRRGA